ncbi:site-specific DNA-methyltransferase [Pleurocapsales cyanobacterium LEGE 10410]|nr:site-specific DNA-methyltransferase [Pleurocapsales cyanobacterium LEGE 10410]
MPSVKIGDKWLLGRHIVYCADTSSNKFINHLPSEAALAIVTPAVGWNHNYSIDKAHIVVVILEEDQIYNFCHHQQMPFQFELLIHNLYIAVFSRRSIHKPVKPSEIEGIEGVVSFLVNQYTHWGGIVLAPFLRNGEILMTCERMGRVCVSGDKNPQAVKRTLTRWQSWTNKQAQKELSPS